MNKVHTNCRVCGSGKLIKYFDAGEMPLANNNTATKEESLSAPRHPLQLMFCDECGLSQLSLVVDPVEMFSNYDYRSAVNKGYVAHCNKMAFDLQKRYNLTEDSFVIDIAGNDGTLLRQFRQVIGNELNVLNVDPATNLCAIAEMDGIDSINDFWSKELAASKWIRSVDLITATNVFAHVDDVNDFILGCQHSLATEGVLILEFPYLVDFIEKLEFDTIYHEHLSYFSILPIIRLAAKNGMKVIDVEKQNIHGGSVRVHLALQESERKIEVSVSDFIGIEVNKGFNKIDRYLEWADKVDNAVHQFQQSLIHAKMPFADSATFRNPKVAAFAASAKGNTLLNYSKIDNTHIDYIVDETPEKIGKYYAGTGIQIVNKSNLLTNPPDFLIILSWNFKEAIIEKCRGLGFKGKFIIPVPAFEIID